MKRKNRISRSKRPKAKVPAKPSSGIAHLLQTWAVELGMDSETLKKALIKSDSRPVAHAVIPLKAIVSALFGEEHVAKVKGMQLDNAKKEREQAEELRELVRMADIEAKLAEWVIVPLSSVLNSAPTTLDTRCNPSDPDLARAAIADWVEKTVKPLLRSKLPRTEVVK